MKYKKFIIHQYKAISQDISINFNGTNIVPIIGVNECGKTTILKAILAFDYQNDKEENRYHHLSNLTNLYKHTKNNSAYVTAVVEVLYHEIKQIINDISAADNDTYYIKITRQINGIKAYNNVAFFTDISLKDDKKTDFSIPTKDINACAQNIIKGCPAIIYYDDFRDRFVERINISNSSSDMNDGFSKATLQNIFTQTYAAKEIEDEKFKLEDMCRDDISENVKNGILTTISKCVNEKLIKNWEKIHIIDENIKHSLQVEFQLSYEKKSPAQPQGQTKLKKSTEPTREYYIDVKIREQVDGIDLFFPVSERSKGFYWFFNFTLKTAFNPKNSNSLLYLLDEPGCYLHSSAQNGLCRILKKLSEKHTIIYNTHSHYLLSLEFLNHTRIAYKEEGNIFLTHYSQYNKTQDNQYQDAMQPIKDALKIAPSLLEQHKERPFNLVVEGIIDFFSLDMFIQTDGIGFLPSVNSESIVIYCSFLVCQKKNFACLFDGDKAGIDSKEKADRSFDKFIPTFTYGADKKLEDMYDNDEVKIVAEKISLRNINTAHKGNITHFIKTLYEHKNRINLLTLMPKTAESFKNLIDEIYKNPIINKSICSAAE